MRSPGIGKEEMKRVVQTVDGGLPLAFEKVDFSWIMQSRLFFD